MKADYTDTNESRLHKTRQCSYLHSTCPDPPAPPPPPRSVTPVPSLPRSVTAGTVPANHPFGGRDRWQEARQSKPGCRRHLFASLPASDHHSAPPPPRHMNKANHKVCCAGSFVRECDLNWAWAGEKGSVVGMARRWDVVFVTGGSKTLRLALLLASEGSVLLH